jgi:hypothetical protein
VAIGFATTNENATAYILILPSPNAAALPPDEVLESYPIAAYSGLGINVVKSHPDSRRPWFDNDESTKQVMLQLLNISPEDYEKEACILRHVIDLAFHAGLRLHARQRYARGAAPPEDLSKPGEPHPLVPLHERRKGPRVPL